MMLFFFVQVWILHKIVPTKQVLPTLSKFLCSLLYNLTKLSIFIFSKPLKNRTGD